MYFNTLIVVSLVFLPSHTFVYYFFFSIICQNCKEKLFEQIDGLTEVHLKFYKKKASGITSHLFFSISLLSSLHKTMPTVENAVYLHGYTCKELLLKLSFFHRNPLTPANTLFFVTTQEKRQMSPQAFKFQSVGRWFSAG